MTRQLMFSSLLSVCLAQQTAILTGGFNGYEGSRDGCELLNQGCSVPPLITVSNTTGGSGRSDREDHITALTEDGVLLTCGGEAGDGTDDLSCIGLDPAASTWSFHSVLTWPRLKATDVTVPGLGLFVIGGFKQLTTEILPVGGDTWLAGPTLPGTEETDYYGICSVLLNSNTEFMVIGGNGDGLFGGTRVQVYNVETEEWTRWSDLSVSRWGHSCTRLDDMVVVGGGVSITFSIMSSTTILDLTTGEERVAGEMQGARAWFGMATIDSKVLAYGGMSPLRDQYSNILQLDTETEQWLELEDKLETARGISSFATAVVHQDQICK